MVEAHTRALRHLEQLIAEHGDAIANTPLLKAMARECRAQVDAAWRGLLAWLSGWRLAPAPSSDRRE